MFGYHKAKREKKRLARQVGELDKKEEGFSQKQQEYDKNQQQTQMTQANERAQQMGEDRKKHYAEGRERIQSLFNDESIHGLDPEKRKAMQYEANKQIQRQHQSANRRLLGDQGMHGVVGKGGVGYAQQRDLQRLADESYGQSRRDIDKMDSDQRMRNLAAIFAGEQGEASQGQLDKQLALDELKLDEERKRQRNFENQFSRLFSRV